VTDRDRATGARRLVRLLAVGLFVLSSIASASDFDGDGVDDAIDNFTTILDLDTEETRARDFDFSKDYRVSNQLGLALFERAKRERTDARRAERDGERGAIKVEHRLRSVAAKASANELLGQRVVSQRLLKVQLIDEALGELVGVLVLEPRAAACEIGAALLAQFFTALGHFLEARCRRRAVGAIKDAANGGGDFGPLIQSRHVGLRVLLQVELATLPGNATKNSDPSGFQTGMIITHDELHAL